MSGVPLQGQAPEHGHEVDDISERAEEVDVEARQLQHAGVQQLHGHLRARPRCLIRVSARLCMLYHLTLRWTITLILDGPI